MSVCYILYLYLQTVIYSVIELMLFFYIVDLYICAAK